MPETIKFQNPNHLHFVNCVLYVDFETRFHQMEPEQVAKQIRRLGSSCNAISVGWHAVGRDGFEEVLKKRELQPLRHGLIRADGSADDAYIAEKAVFAWLQLAEQHVYKQNVHKTFGEATMSFEEVQKHNEATHCVL